MSEDKNKPSNLENKILDTENSEEITIANPESKIDFESLRRKQVASIMAEKEQKKNRMPVKETDIRRVPKDKLFTKAAVWKCFNLKEETENLINGEQAESLNKYKDEYYLEFDHIML